MSRLLRRASVAFFVASWMVGGVVLGQDSPDELLFKKVMDRLLSADLLARDYPKDFAWPPKYFVKPKSAKEVNAYASAHRLHGATVDEESGKVRPVVMITEGMLTKVIEGDENSLAVIMGHELAHLTKNHVMGQKADTPLLELAFNRDQEVEADLDGVKYAVAAGYPYKTGVAKAIHAMREKTRSSSFEGLSSSHPTWEDRLILLDRDQSKIWTAMSAFQNGFVFLELEQYLAAQQCFKAVVAEFPDCQEGWANLGYALLMQYCDGLDSDDLRTYGIGQIVAGGFYSRPRSLENKVRGIDEKLWNDAVKALNKAVALNPDLVLARANLGVAYLVHPEGKQAKKACHFFEEALKRSKNDVELKKNPISMAALLMNSGVADLARGNTEETAVKFRAAAKLSMDEDLTALSKTLEDALFFNQALLDAQSKDLEKQRKACKLLEVYLSRCSPDSSWWSLAWESYSKIAKAINFPTKSREDFSQRDRPTLMRLATSITIGSEIISLSEPVKDATRHLGKDVVSQPLFAGSKIMRWHSTERGIDLLGKDRVLAIFLTDAKSPPLLIREIGVGAKAQELRVGMTEKEALGVLKGQRADKGRHFIDNTRVGFRFYPELGLGIRLANERVEQLVIAQIPRRSADEK